MVTNKQKDFKTSTMHRLFKIRLKDSNLQKPMQMSR